ncbi:MAG: hypothetical protein A4E62_00122 [Syntrophorhabdus sp. PtaU1.Bin002]|nr:MAG: hypothetical protein A4E58_00287 [Syntrophorhabdus sp. PtaB.Bin006]OPY73975.1 MAG: hypothetical protein A4E62_00122 [Syntrophorhabdus sp. PtaU1.Bin002]
MTILASRKVVFCGMIVMVALGTISILMFEPERPGIWAVGMVVIVGLAAFLASRVMERRSAEIEVRQRETLDDDTTYSLFYADSGLAAPFVAELWHEIADTLGVPPGKLRPTDRFGYEIGNSFWITTEALDTLAAIAIRRAKEYHGAINWELIKTVDDYVRQLAALKGAKGTPRH